MGDDQVNTQHNTVCRHGTPYVDHCEACEGEHWRCIYNGCNSLADFESDYCAQHDAEVTVSLDRLRTMSKRSEHPLPLVLGGQGKNSATVRASGAWAGLAIIALSFGTVLLFLGQWLGWWKL